MRFGGTAIAPESARKADACLHCGGNGDVRLVVGGEEYTARLAQCRVGEALGSLPRTLTLPDGWSFTAQDTKAFNQWLDTASAPSQVHRLEQSRIAIAASVVGVIAAVWLFVQFGLPAVSMKIAAVLPEVAHEKVGEQTLATLDRTVLEPSELPDEHQMELRDFFQTLQSGLQIQGGARLLFRKMDEPNAIALAGGTVIISDAMVAMCADNQELAAVLLHELGHHHHNHVMHQVVSSTILSVLYAYAIADAGAVAEVLAGSAVLAMSAGYSREHEAEADAYALDHLQSRYGSTGGFERLFAKFKSQDEDYGWLSSHPDTKARIKAASNY